MTRWRPMDSVPTDRTPVLVLLESKLLKSRVHVATFGITGNGSRIGFIASVLEYDAPKVLGWFPLSDILHHYELEPL